MSNDLSIPHRYRWLLILLAAGAGVIGLMLFVDPITLPWVVRIFRTPTVEAIHSVLKHLGRPPVLYGALVICGITALVKRSRAWGRATGLLALTMAVALIACYLLKMGVARPRPEFAYFAVGWGDAIGRPDLFGNGMYHSFPSGDVTLASALAVLLFLFAGRGKARWALFLIPVLSSVGRVLHAGHYPSDCLAAMMLGGGVAASVWRLWPPRPAPADVQGGPR